MKRIAVFGNAGGGKSTLARKLAELTGLPLYPLDMIQYRAGGGEVPHDDYLKAHARILQTDAWIIDGFGSVTSAWERFAAADTLVYVDPPLLTHFRWVTKRLLSASPEIGGRDERVPERRQARGARGDSTLACERGRDLAGDHLERRARLARVARIG